MLDSVPMTRIRDLLIDCIYAAINETLLCDVLTNASQSLHG